MGNGKGSPHPQYEEVFRLGNQLDGLFQIFVFLQGEGLIDVVQIVGKGLLEKLVFGNLQIRLIETIRQSHFGSYIILNIFLHIAVAVIAQYPGEPDDRSGAYADFFGQIFQGIKGDVILIVEQIIGDGFLGMGERIIVLCEFLKKIIHEEPPVHWCIFLF